MISPETIQKIKETAHIEEVVSRFLSLRKRGTNYVACCPFHQEKTGSFNVNPARNIYKCFGCGKSGDSISFLMEHDHKTYPEALRFLADMYSIPIEEEEQSEELRERQRHRDSLLKLCAHAQKRFAQELADHPDLLIQQGITPVVAEAFGLGLKQGDFCPQAVADGYSKRLLADAGLADAQGADLLPPGLIFPIFSKDGKPISFVSRGERWTFLPATALFDYGRALFGLFQAKKEMGRSDKCFLLSRFDLVLSMHQSGIANSLSPCSSALTAEQAKDIRRFTSNVTLVCSASRALSYDVSALFAAGMHLRVVVFPQGETPDSFARQHGATALLRFLEDHEENLFLFRAARLLEQPDTIGAMLRQVSDPIERGTYLPLLAEMLNQEEQRLRALWGIN